MYLQPAPFHFDDPNWKPLDAKLPILKDSDPKELGYGGRDYQVRCYNKFHNKYRTIFIAPTGSGKSLVQVFNAAREIIDLDYQQKQVFVVPQLNIGNGFTHHKHQKLLIDGKVYHWKIALNCCPSKGYVEQLSKKVTDFLLKKHPCKYERANSVLGGCTAVVSYAALLAAFSKMTPKQRLQAIQNTSFRLDEIHHISGVDEVSVSNRLGEFTKFVLDNEGSLHLTTATFFRGDRQLILGNSYLEEFEIFRVPFDEHWKNLGLKSLHQDYVCYNNGDDLLDRIISSIKSEPNQSPLIIVPSDGMKFLRDVDKWKWVTKLVNELNLIYGSNKVLDLVSPDRQKEDKKRLTSSIQDFSAVVTCSIGREGTDWPACSRVHNTILDGNTLQVVQKMGRALRQYDGKIDVKMFNYIEYFDSWDSGREVVRERLSDRFNAVMATSVWDDYCYPIFMMPTLESNNDGQKTSNSGPRFTLEDVYGIKRNDLIEDLLRKVLSLPKSDQTDESIDEIIQNIIEEYDDDMIEDVPIEFVKERLRKEIFRLLNPSDPNLKMDGMIIDFIRKKGWDKVVKEDIKDHSPFVGSFKTEDLQELQKILVSCKEYSKRKTLEEWVIVAEELALANNGLLPSQGWLQKNGYGSLSQFVASYPESFSHLIQNKFPKKSLVEWVIFAEEMASKNGDILPHGAWLKNNGYQALSLMLSRYPDHFLHINKDKKIKSLEDWVVFAEEFAKKSGGKLKGVGWLTKNGYSGLAAAMKKYPVNFEHIPQEKTRTSIEEHILVAEQLAKQNNNVLPSARWLEEHGYASLAGAISRLPNSFNHLQQEIFRRSIEEWVVFAEKLSKENDGTLPCHSWLVKNNYSGLASAILKSPESFAHILMESKRGKSPDEWIPIAELLAKENGGVLQNSAWLQQNGFAGLYSAIVDNPEKFSHIQQIKKGGKSLVEWLSIADELASKNNGKIPSYTWLKKNGFNGLHQSIRKYPEVFANLSQDANKIRVDEHVVVAQKLATENGGTLPNLYWLETNGHAALSSVVRKNPDKFSHIKREIKSGKTVDEQVKIAETIANKHNGILPCTTKLKKMNYGGLVGCMYTHPDKFSHIKREIKSGKTVQDRVIEAENLAAENDGVLQNHRWLQQNGHSALSQSIVKNPEWFKHIKQTRIGRTPQELLAKAEVIAKENGGILPSYTEIRKVDSGLASALHTKPELFQHLQRKYMKPEEYLKRTSIGTFVKK